MATKPAPEPPEVDPAYASLSLADLRDLRRELGDEESRVSYWRRIIQARIDLLTRGGADGDLVERLTSVLAESGAVHRRLANLSVKPASDIDALPDLHVL
jgi:RsiG-like